MGKKAGDLPREQRTVYRLLKRSASVWGAAPALHQPDGRGGYRTWSWVEYRQAAEEIACGLRAMGIAAGDVVGLASETRAEFYLADAGVMTNGSIAAAVYTSLPPADQVRTLVNCEPKAVFVENPKMLRTLEASGLGVLAVPRILLEGEAEGATTLEALRELGVKAMVGDQLLMERIEAEVQPSHHAILYLTSGATGEPKMGLVTHNAIVANVDLGPKVIDLDDEDRSLAFLPSAHITQRLVMELLMLRMGVPVYFSEGLSKMPAELRSVKPTFIIAPPRVWERIYASVTTEIRKKPLLIRRLFYLGVGVGNEATRAKEAGREPAPWVKSSLKFFDKVVFAKIRERLGGRLRLAVSGAAPLGRELATFYSSIGLRLIEGYGLTEGGVVALNPIDRPIAGSIGKALPGVELKAAEDGELLIRGETVFSGYYKDPASTAAVLRDGWLHTGDIARVNGDGYWFITGRKKELIVSSNGKKIYPARIEGLFKLEPLINQVLLIGDRLPYMTALITVNAPESERTSEAVQQEVRRIVKSVNRQLAPFEQIRRFKVLERDFSLENGEMTPTMKLRRTRVLENFKAEISELYVGREEF
ncbi:MAG: long-chain fatty acid--CoA ligase [Bryobacteraceae bacterium]|nr:long-chain fatty acid--CoA ligase [Bryobacteraceae bacterium]